MFTWNFQYVSRARLAETFNQLSLNSQRGDILIRIHTAIHSEEEAVELAAFIKEQVPGAHIFGTSTSAIIQDGKVIPGQCVISVTQMTHGSIYTAILPTFDKNDDPLPVERLCMDMRENAAGVDTKLLLTFLTNKYLDVYKFVDMCNDFMPGVRMIGGIASTPELSLGKVMKEGYVFDEKGWSSRSIIVAAISGEDYEVYNYYATGVQSIGEEMEITDADDNIIGTLDGRPADEVYRETVGEAVKERPEIAGLFPFVYSDTSDVPIFVEYKNDCICANHNVVPGKKIKRAFIYDRKIIADNKAMFRRIENFEKAETIFGYSCIGRTKQYLNSVKWELSAYENSNICGCITEGEIAYANGKNTFANMSFVISVMGEAPATQRFNSYVFSHTESLSVDNNSILSYLMEIEGEIESESKSKKVKVPKELTDFVRDCELNLMRSENEDLPNEAALSMDMKVKGYDRICMIRVTDTASMEAVFSEQVINMTYRNFIAKCATCAEKKNYHIYVLDKWHLAIGAPSYMVKLSQFKDDMEALQNDLFSTTADFVAIVPNFCIIDNCTVENLADSYNTARMEMTQKNIQFLVYDGGANVINVESIRERYHMVNVINYAIAHDGVVPYFQGIHDNELGTIHHYESLMRIKDEDGKIYYPGEFLDVARSYGLLYDSISRIMIQKVFDKFRDYPQLSVSINLGLRDIKNDEITEIIYDNLSSVKHPENFVFEILENEDIEEYGSLVSFVDKIHSLGGMISIDDFGSGYSNLQHILSIQADFLKLDGSIIRNCHVDRESENLVALMGAWKDLSSRKMAIIAEYVENKEIQKKLIMYGIDYSQGYLFSKPSPQIGDVK